MLKTFLTPAILVVLILFVWRDLSGRMERGFKHLNDRIDRHLEGHA